MTSITEVLAQFNTSYRLGVPSMDDTHLEFINMVQAAIQADTSEFASAFNDLFQHTKVHFATEEEVMTRLNHGSKAEHIADHQRILGDMDRFNQRAAAGRASMARAWVGDSLLQWFHTHAQTMDSALAADIKATS